jgi:diguanylate cyclase (GGDEF)-like protein
MAKKMEPAAQTHKILVIDDNPDLREIITHNLTREGFSIIQSQGALDGIQKAADEKPDLIILDVVLPVMDGFQVCAILKGKRETADIPVIFLSARDQVDDKVRGLNLGGIDYISKPFKSEELNAKIKSLLRSRDHDIGLNPLSLLPGNKVIEEKLHEFLRENKKFAVGYVDIDNFKSYNDKYGFFRGDEVLLTLSKNITSAIRNLGREDDFIGHIGGDDFIFISFSEKTEDICKSIIANFDKAVPSFYETPDKTAGYIEMHNRIGMLTKIPLMTLSVAVVTNNNRQINHPGEIAAIAAELKGYLKTFSGSNFKIDQRTSNESKEIIEKKKIMVIEPNSEIAKKFDQSLLKKNVFVRYVENGASALLLMTSMRPDLILMNAHLPLIDGFTLFGQIKKNMDLATIPVFIYSSEPFDRLITRGEVKIPPENFIDLNNLEIYISDIMQKVV